MMPSKMQSAKQVITNKVASMLPISFVGSKIMSDRTFPVLKAGAEIVYLKPMEVYVNGWPDYSRGWFEPDLNKVPAHLRERVQRYSDWARGKLQVK